MAIIYDSKEQIFTLETKKTTYQMKVAAHGFLLHLYYGNKIMGNTEYLLTYYDRGFSGNPYESREDRTFSMDVLPQEFPCSGNGDYRSCAIDIKNPDGTNGCDLRYVSHKITKGKYHLPGLPAVYAKEEEAETLEIVLQDKNSLVTVTLLYGVLEEKEIITRSAKVVNQGTGKIYVKRLQSACLDFLYGEYEVMSFYGRHAMERNVQRQAVGHGNYQIGSRRGTSSHQYNPLLILAEPDTNEDAGDCYAMSYVYSGGFSAEVERDQFNQTRMMMGLQSEGLSYPLEEKEELWGPEVILTFSGKGLSVLSHQLHTCIKNHVCRGKYKNQIPPILVNSWEAAYFDFNGNTILELAKQAKDVGIEMVVMDDGWFGKRNDDNTSLGDWQVNEEKLGCTLSQLIEDINEIGVKFGIWVEPEMISEDSELYRLHPDWAFAIEGRKPICSRNQLVLDFSRREVVDYVYDAICKVLDMGNIEYLKWDMNRSITDVCSKAMKDTGRIRYDYVLGLYDFLERIVIRYPNLLIEGCSGGGGRFDAGMLYYTPQIWCSDNTDAIDRLEIQYGTSFGYPIQTTGSHVSAVPNHQTGRVVPLKTRGITAMAGTFGYELDLSALAEEEKEEIREYNERYKAHAPLIRDGNYYRLSNPQTANIAVWEFTSENQKESLVSIVRIKNHGNMTVDCVRLKGLCMGVNYKEEVSGNIYSGSALMTAGIPIPAVLGEYDACQMYFKQI